MYLLDTVQRVWALFAVFLRKNVWQVRYENLSSTGCGAELRSATGSLADCALCSIHG